MTAKAIPLFPLTAHVMPQGLLKLRIFEPRYLRMVKESYARDHAFVMCMLKTDDSADESTQAHVNENKYILPVGTLVSVIDFDTSIDGLLNITVKGLSLVHITNVETQHDGLRIGDISTIKPWKCQAPLAVDDLVVNKLKHAYETYVEIAHLYPEPKFTDTVWVAYRWLELIAIAPEEKIKLITEHNVDVTMQWLRQTMAQTQ